MSKFLRFLAYYLGTLLCSLQLHGWTSNLHAVLNTWFQLHFHQQCSWNASRRWPVSCSGCGNFRIEAIFLGIVPIVGIPITARWHFPPISLKKALLWYVLWTQWYICISGTCWGYFHQQLWTIGASSFYYRLKFWYAVKSRNLQSHQFLVLPFHHTQAPYTPISKTIHIKYQCSFFIHLSLTSNTNLHVRSVS